MNNTDTVIDKNEIEDPTLTLNGEVLTIDSNVKHTAMSEEYKNMCTRFVFYLSDFELSFDDEDVFLYLIL